MYFRLISKIPVIIMGETGIGKTALIDLLSNIMDTQFITLKVHAGMSNTYI
jgi:MoxR-like ATPase